MTAAELIEELKRVNPKDVVVVDGCEVVGVEAAGSKYEVWLRLEEPDEEAE